MRTAQRKTRAYGRQSKSRKTGSQMYYTIPRKKVIHVDTIPESVLTEVCPQEMARLRMILSQQHRSWKDLAVKVGDSVPFGDGKRGLISRLYGRLCRAFETKTGFKGLKLVVYDGNKTCWSVAIEAPSTATKEGLRIEKWINVMLFTDVPPTPAERRVESPEMAAVESRQ